MFLHKLDNYKKTCDECKKKQILDQKTTNIIIDEWDINSNQSMYRKELAKIYVKRMGFVVVLNDQYVECQLQEGNQLAQELCLSTCKRTNKKIFCFIIGKRK